MAVITRLSSGGHGTRRTGSFANKAANAVIVGAAGEILDARPRHRLLLPAARTRILSARRP